MNVELQNFFRDSFFVHPNVQYPQSNSNQLYNHMTCSYHLPLPHGCFSFFYFSALKGEIHLCLANKTWQNLCLHSTRSLLLLIILGNQWVFFKFPAPECYLRYKSCLYLLFFSHHRVSDPRKSMFLPWNRVGVSVQGITSTDSRCSAILVAHRDYLPLIRSLKSAVYHEGIGNRGQCLAWKRWNCFSLLRFGMANSMMRFLHSKGSHFRGRSWYYKGILHLAALVVSWRAKVSSLDSEGSGK